jgi:hypothetical protein
VQQGAPARRIGREAEAGERQRRFGQDRRGQELQALQTHEAQRGRREVAPYDPSWRCPQGARRDRELLQRFAGHDGTHPARHDRPAEQRQHGGHQREHH